MSSLISRSLFRDTDFEAFYNVELRYKLQVIAAHMTLFLLPALVSFIYLAAFESPEFMRSGITVITAFYLGFIAEATFYLFLRTREFYKKFMWIITAGIMFTGFLLGFYVGSFINYSHDELPLVEQGILPLLSSLDPSSRQMIVLIGSFGLTYLGIWFFLRTSHNLYRQASLVNAEIRFAAEVQKRILSGSEIRVDGLTASAESISAAELGGDFYELSEHDGSLIASVGDISGHGFGAGLLMATTRSALQTHLRYKKDLAEIMHALNHLLLEQSDRRMFATLMLARIHPGSLQVELCNAGHIPAYHFQKHTGTLVTRYIRGNGLGITSRSEYQVLVFSMEPGDLLIMCSDGYTETRNRAGKMHKASHFEERLLQVCLTHSGHMQELRNALDQALFPNAVNKPEDDATLIVIQSQN